MSLTRRFRGEEDAISTATRKKKGIFDKHFLIWARLKIILKDCHSDTEYETHNQNQKNGGISAPTRGTSRVNLVISSHPNKAELIWGHLGPHFFVLGYFHILYQYDHV